jgi:hypothetical protein
MEIPVPDEFGPAFIFGEVFMREWYTVYSRGNGLPGSAMVGFALAQAPPKEVTDKIRLQNSVTQWKKGDVPKAATKSSDEAVPEAPDPIKQANDAAAQTSADMDKTSGNLSDQLTKVENDLKEQGEKMTHEAQGLRQKLDGSGFSGST